MKHASFLPEAYKRSAKKPWTPMRLVLFASLALLAVFLLSCNRHVLQVPYAVDFSGNATKIWETLFLSVPDGESARQSSRRLSAHPHLAGSPQDFEDAKWMLEFFQTQFGVDPPQSEPIFDSGTEESRGATLGLTKKHNDLPSVWIDVYYPYIDAPVNSSLEILGDTGIALWTADLTEDGDPLDPEAHQHRNDIPPWLSYSAEGIAEGKLVYANYGTQEDLQELLDKGVDFTGKIVIVRYGGIYRGLKVKGAAQLGAAGVIIYSDPRDDGYITVENGYAPYPHGPARNPTSVQRGGTMDGSLYPGDPLTPGYPAYKDAERQDPKNIPTIPCIPISWHNAQRLLAEIGSYYERERSEIVLSGRTSEATVRFEVHVDAGVKPIWNTMASIPGQIRDEVVLVGCHRDAWVLGGADPNSGTVSLIEIVKGLGVLLKHGWQPLRTIVFASWDAEEQGLIGSTEYGEDFADWIAEHVVAYLNVDVSVSGSQWGIGGSPSLAPLLKQVALEIPHPTVNGKSLWDAREDDGPFANATGIYNGSLRVDLDCLEKHKARKAALATVESGVEPLGSGSDYTVFLQRIGVASTDQGFGSGLHDPVYHYHSIYDSVHWQEVYADPDFKRHIAVAKHLGLSALRLTDSAVLPLNTTQYALELDDYLDKVEHLAATAPSTIQFPDLRSSIKKLQNASARLDKEKEDIADELASSKAIPLAEPCSLSIWLRKISETLSWILSWGSPSSSETDTTALRLATLNKKLSHFEQGFIDEGGIKDREWYRHLGVAPGKWLGYGATTFPGLTEAIAIDKNVTLAKIEEQRLITLLDRLAEDFDA